MRGIRDDSTLIDPLTGGGLTDAADAGDARSSRCVFDSMAASHSAIYPKLNPVIHSRLRGFRCYATLRRLKRCVAQRCGTDVPVAVRFCHPSPGCNRPDGGGAI